MAFAASPSLSSLTASRSSSDAAAAASVVSSSTSSCSAFHEPRPLHLSLKPVSPLPKAHLLSYSVPAPHVPRAIAGDKSGDGNRGDGSGGNGGKDEGGGRGGEDDDDYEEAEFGQLLGFDEVLRLATARGVALPGDMMEAAKDAGIREVEVLLLRYIDLQAAPLLLGAMIWAFFMLHNRMLADPSFLFKVGTEVDASAIAQLFLK